MAQEQEPISPDVDNLDPDKEARQLLNPPADSVQFTQNLSTVNGQVSIAVPGNRPGVGMTKQELMKYAQDPFWIRLRMFLFILFWVVWFAMLIGAVLIIAFAPGCPATASLPWWSKCSIAQVNVRGEINTKSDLVKQATEAAEDLNKLSNQLDTIHSGQIDGLIINGLSPFLLFPAPNGSSNATLQALDSFKKSLEWLVSQAHDEKRKMKVVIDLEVRWSSISVPWFEQARHNNSQFQKYYIWSESSQLGTKLYWAYDSDKFMFYGSKQSRNDIAYLNYEDENLKDDIKRLVISWIRTKIDGVQIHDGLYKLGQNEVYASESYEPLEFLRKHVKATGEKKAFFVVTDPENTAEKRSAIPADFVPNWDISSSLRGDAVAQKLADLFAEFADLEGNDTVPISKEQLARQWKAFYILMPNALANEIAKKHGLEMAEGITAALYFLPKATPVIQLDAQQLDKGFESNGTNSVLFKMSEIRSEQLESFLLGKTHVLKTNDAAVLAVYRHYPEKNGYLFVFNTGDLPKTLKLDEGYPRPDPVTHSAKVLLTDRQHMTEVGTVVGVTKLKIEPKQWLLIEFSLSI